jgi:S-formylglutathione hydrolase
LICALKNPGAYRSVSAIAPICHPGRCGWGETCFSAYMGDDRSNWQAWDATQLVEVWRYRLR